MHNDTQAPKIQLMTSFIVKFSPSMCVAVVAEVAARSFAYQTMEQILLLSMAMTKY